MENFAIGAALVIWLAFTAWMVGELHVARSLNGRLQREVEHSRKYADKIAAEFERYMTSERLRKQAPHFPPIFTPAEMDRASEANVHQRRWRDSLTTEPKPPIEWNL